LLLLDVFLLPGIRVVNSPRLAAAPRRAVTSLTVN
jgi:hypothetical protein